VIAQLDTIVALSTPAGRSGIGVIRLSGPASLEILRRLIATEDFGPQPNLLTLRHLIDPFTGDTMDQALVCYFKAPHSFTGEDVVELHCHGSPVLLRRIIDVTLRLDARLADAGEFSMRAVANGRLRLTEAEAIRDLIDAQTDDALRQATRQLDGAISNFVQPAKDELLRIIVRLESSLEFVEDDLPGLEQDQIARSLASLRFNLDQLAKTFARGKLLRDGLKVTLVGRPNAGKSSLFNRLLGHERAIVTAIPGTTRDTITEAVGLEGLPLVLTDTAGLRAASDQIEALGVDRTRREAADSDLLILVIDGSAAVTDEDRQALAGVGDRPCIIALNKSDLPSFSVAAVDVDFIASDKPKPIIAVSARTEAGLERLRAAILEPFTNGFSSGDGLLITNARHYDLLSRAVKAVGESQHLLSNRSSEELVLVGLHNALQYLGELTGETTSDEILGQIFATFCIGK
jgi:tRNA modification GTPase